MRRECASRRSLPPIRARPAATSGTSKGNFGGDGGRIDVSDINVHPTLDDLLADDTVDLVDICLPSYLHSKIAQRVLRAGKNAIVEKPVALSVADAEKMQAAAKKSGQMLLVAQVLKYFPEFELLEKAIHGQRWGELRALHLRRIIAKPDWGDDNWLADPKSPAAW